MMSGMASMRGWAMQPAFKVISVGWGVLAFVIAAMGVIRAFLPQRDDLGIGIIVVSSFAAGLGIAAIAMLVGAAMGVHALLTRPPARTIGGVAATGGTLVALFGIAHFVVRLVSG